MHTESPRPQSQSLDLGWTLIGIVMALTFCLIALPWIIIGCIAERLLARWLHWRLSLLLWVVLGFVSAFVLYAHYQHDLRSLMNHEMTDYVVAVKHDQLDLARWPLHQLWVDTGPVWFSTFPGIGIAGFAAEIFGHTRQDTAQTLRQQERRRHLHAQRLQRRARKRTSHLTRLPDALGDMMFIGVVINDETQEGYDG